MSFTFVTHLCIIVYISSLFFQLLCVMRDFNLSYQQFVVYKFLKLDTHLVGAFNNLYVTLSVVFYIFHTATYASNVCVCVCVCVCVMHHPLRKSHLPRPVLPCSADPIFRFILIRYTESANKQTTSVSSKQNILVN